MNLELHSNLSVRICLRRLFWPVEGPQAHRIPKKLNVFNYPMGHICVLLTGRLVSLTYSNNFAAIWQPCLQICVRGLRKNSINL